MTTAEAPASEAASGSPLTLPPEPLDLRARIRQEVLDGAGWLASPGDDHGLGDTLWQYWGPVLEGLGTGRRHFDVVVAGYRRELWFWVLGDRTWEQAAGGLAGRQLRRLPPA